MPGVVGGEDSGKRLNTEAAATTAQPPDDRFMPEDCSLLIASFEEHNWQRS